MRTRDFTELRICILDIIFYSHCDIESALIKRLCVGSLRCGFLCKKFILVHVSEFLFEYLKRNIMTVHLKTDVDSVPCVELVIDEHESCS